MLDWDLCSEKTLPFLNRTEDSSPNAPLQQYTLYYWVLSILRSCLQNLHSKTHSGLTAVDPSTGKGKEIGENLLMLHLASLDLSRNDFPIAGVEWIAKN